MPRRPVHKSDLYSFDGIDYRINVRADSGVYASIMEDLCKHIVCGYSKGRWSVLHIRYLLGDGATNRLLLDAMRSRLGKMHRYVWTLEESKQDDGDQHYHMALFINSREVNMQSIRYLLIELKNRSLIKHYKKIPPDISKSSLELQGELDPGEIEEVVSRFGLELSNQSAVRYAIYWLSYIAKEKTKVLDGRTFGASKLPDRWRETATRMPG